MKRKTEGHRGHLTYKNDYENKCARVYTYLTKRGTVVKVTEHGEMSLKIHYVLIWQIART
jgi:hypothetical protein